MKFKKKLYKNFLLSNQSNVISYAISKLHSTYEILENKKKINFYSSLKKYMAIIFDFSNKYSPNKKKIDVIIISNIISKYKLNHDEYFGDLAYRLNQKKINTFTIFRNFTSLPSKKIRKQIKTKNSIILSKRASYKIELLIIFKFLKEILIFLFTNKYSILGKNLNVIDFFSIISNLRFYFQLNEILKFYKTKKIIFTYEGHAWERLLVHLCRNSGLNINSIAYQFSIIKKNQYGMFNRLKKDYNPDFIASSGKIPNKLLKKKIKFSEIINLGSAKYIKPKKKFIKNNDLLVALDADDHKLKNVINFIKGFARKYKGLKIILRPHPISINNSSLIDKIKYQVSDYKNIKLSYKNLDKDLAGARYLLFTESAVCFTCLNFNVVPLFFKIDNGKNVFDKYYPKRYEIKSHTGLKNIIKNKENKNLKKYFQKYRDNYFQKYDLNYLEKIINKL